MARARRVTHVTRPLAHVTLGTRMAVTGDVRHPIAVNDDVGNS